MVERNEYHGLMSTVVITCHVVCVYLHLCRLFFTPATDLPLGHIQITSGVTRSLSSWIIYLIILHRVSHESEHFVLVLIRLRAR